MTTTLSGSKCLSSNAPKKGGGGRPGVETCDTRRRGSQSSAGAEGRQRAKAPPRVLPLLTQSKHFPLGLYGARRAGPARRPHPRHRERRPGDASHGDSRRRGVTKAAHAGCHRSDTLGAATPNPGRETVLSVGRWSKEPRRATASARPSVPRIDPLHRDHENKRAAYPCSPKRNLSLVDRRECEKPDDGQ
jgi:hypothetical protein